MQNLNKWTGRNLIQSDGLKIINNPIELEYKIGFHYYLILMNKTCYCSTRGFGRIRFDANNSNCKNDWEQNHKLICSRHEISGTILKFLK